MLMSGVGVVNTDNDSELGIVSRKRLVLVEFIEE